MLLTHSYDNINSNQYTGLVFLDLTKAFDSVNHDILLLKLEHYGIHGSANQLIKSFLSRKQFVSIKGAKSKLLHNNYGVPQGSILGPLLFLLYVNDMPQAVNCMPILFADDTCLIFTAPNLASLTTIINKELQNLSIWFDFNKFMVNPSKSNFLIIPPKLNKPFLQTNVFLNNISIPQCISIRYLGLTIDMNLNFDFHISNIAYKTSRTVGIISKIRHYLTKTALLKIYYAQIHSYLLYGLIIWGSTFLAYLKKLITLQNKAVKFICAAKFCDSCSPYYKCLKILKLKDLYKLEVGKFIHANF